MRTEALNKGRTVKSGFRPSLWQRFRRRAVIARVHASRVISMGGNTRTARGVRDWLRALVALVVGLLRGALRTVFSLLIVLVERVSVLRDPLSRAMEWLLYWVHRGRLAVRHACARYLERGHSRFAGCILLACATILIFSASYFGLALEVKLGGLSLGYVGSKEEVEAVVAEVEQRATEYLGRPYLLNLDFTYSLAYKNPDNALQPEAVKELLFSQITEVSTQYALTVDGQVIGANGSRTALELLRQRILNASAPAGESVKTSFVQEVKIEERPVANADIKSIDQIEELLSANVQEVEIYVVKSGDTVSEIGEAHGMRVKEIQALNPDLNVNRITVGDEIKLQAAKPLLSVQYSRKETYTESIAYEEVVEKNPDMYKNQSKITQKGQNGQARVTANVTYVDGEARDRQVLEYQVVAEPVTQIKQVGTKEPPTKAAKGFFVLPFRGIRTSTYGWRSRGDFHTGLDLAGPAGSPIVAADGGTVTYAARKGTYGLCVIIDHGNGYQTLYAHCSKLLVKPGQKVAQGEQIARVGSTGNSTGPHCHWEVRKNGKTLNPANYI